MPRVRSKKEGDEDIDFDEFLGVNRSPSKKIKKREMIEAVHLN